MNLAAKRNESAGLFVNISLKVPRSLLENIDSLSVKDDRTRSSLLRVALNDYVDSRLANSKKGTIARAS